MPTPEDRLQAPNAVDTTATLRVAALADRYEAQLLDRLLQDVGGFAVEPVASVGELVGAVESGRVDIVVLAVDRVGGWPVPVAEDLAAKLQQRAPLIVVCEAMHDGEVIEQRIGWTGVTVLIRASLTAALLVDAIRAAVARQQRRRNGPSR